MAKLLGLEDARVEVSRLTMAFGDFVVQRDLDFAVRSGSIFAIMGGSGCGKSTLLRHMIGLLRPASGKVRIEGQDLWACSEEGRAALLRGAGVLFQGGALWSSMSLAENVGLPLEEATELTAAEIREVAAYKLSLVGLSGFEDYHPSEISGGMRKRAGLARAIALDPKLLFFDEPSAGLDPVSSRRLDDLILELRDSLGATIIIVSHELASIFAIADDSVFLDAETRTQIARGNPRELLEHCPETAVRKFLTRGEA